MSKTNTMALLLTLLMAIMEMTAIPAVFFVHVQVLNINPMYFILMINFLLAFGMCWVFKKVWLQDWNLGFQLDGIGNGVKKYGIPAILATIFVCIGFFVGLLPFNQQPTIWKVLVEGIVYYVGVAIMEELYLRALLQNWIEKHVKNTFVAIMVTSLLFGLGHIVGALNQPIYTIVAKTIWATALGIYFGAIYVKTRNLWVPILLHFIIDLAGLPFCFSTSSSYPMLSLIVCLLSYGMLGWFGIRILGGKYE